MLWIICHPPEDFIALRTSMCLDLQNECSNLGEAESSQHFPFFSHNVLKRWETIHWIHTSRHQVFRLICVCVLCVCQQHCGDVSSKYVGIFEKTLPNVWDGVYSGEIEFYHTSVGLGLLSLPWTVFLITNAFFGYIFTKPMEYSTIISSNSNI